MPQGGRYGENKDESDSRVRPYPPSWIDRLNGWLRGWAGPSWAHYGGIGVALLALQVGVLAAEGVRPIGAFLPAHVFLAAMIASFPALASYLDWMAEAALVSLRPALTMDDDTYLELQYRLTTLPPFPTLLACGIAASTIVVINEGLGTPAGFNRLADYPVSAAMVYGVYVVTWWTWGAFVYHTLHQLRLIDHIYTHHTRVNVFRSGELYAFSGTAAVTAVSLTLPTYAWLAINQSLRDPTAIGITFPISALALVAFVWPQLGARRLLAQEKRRLLEEVSMRLETLIVELREPVERRDLERVDALTKLIAALRIEEDRLKAVSTWPWQPETASYVVTAVLLPLVLWLIQLLLQRVFGS